MWDTLSQRFLGSVGFEFWRAWGKVCFSQQIDRVYFKKIVIKSHLCSGVVCLNSFGITMTNDSSNLTTADEAITFLVNQGIYDFCEFQHYTSTSTSLSVILIGLLLRTTSDFQTFAGIDLAAPKVRIKVETALAVEKIESVAFSDGLEPEQLLNLVKLGTSGKYGESKCQMTSDVGRDVALMLLITHVTFNFSSLLLLLCSNLLK